MLEALKVCLYFQKIAYWFLIYGDIIRSQKSVRNWKIFKGIDLV